MTRDETIRSSHDTKRIDTKEDDMVIYDTIWVVIVNIQTFTIFTFFFMITLKINLTEVLVSLKTTLAIRFTKELDKTNHL